MLFALVGPPDVAGVQQGQVLLVLARLLQPGGYEVLRLAVEHLHVDTQQVQVLLAMAQLPQPGGHEEVGATFQPLVQGHSEATGQVVGLPLEPHRAPE